MITDGKGNKLPQPEVRKRDATKAVRVRRANENKPQFCDECGFRVRGEGHMNGAHHKGNVKLCSRG